MMVLAWLIGCNGCGSTTDTDLVTDTPTDTGPATDTDSKDKKDGNNDSAGSTGDTADVAICAGTEACWRFERATETGEVADISGNENTLILGGQATIAGPGRPIPGADNQGVLDMDGEPDLASLTLGGNLATFAGGLTLEALALADETTPWPEDSEGDRIRYVAWFEDDAFSLRLEDDGAGNLQVRARANWNGDGSGDCAVEATGPISGTESWCLSATYADGELLVFVDGVQVGSAEVGGSCTDTGPVTPLAAGRFHVGADDTAGDGVAGDRTWRGKLDELRITAGALEAGSLFCAQGTRR